LFDIDTTRASRAKRARLRRRIGTVFQDCRLADELSVADNVALPLRIDGAPEKARRDNVAALLDWLAIANRSAARPSTLSASDRQRVALARAMVRRPDLLLADEPAGAGDDDDLALLLVGAYEQMTQLGTIVLVATRDTGFAERFAHPRLHLDAGTLSSSGAAL
jgi:cell division transport system ATP-binding protein